MAKKKPTGRGGSRPGAGRPALFGERKHYTVWLEQKWADRLNAEAERLGEPVSRLIAVAIGQWLDKR